MYIITSGSRNFRLVRPRTRGEFLRFPCYTIGREPMGERKIMNNKTLDFARGLQEVSSEENGGKILFATDDFFAVAENLLKSEEPIWNDEYTEFGKWMDGWETRRKRTAGHDWAIIQLGCASVIRGFSIDTGFFSGNYAPNFSLQAAYINDDIRQIQNRKDKMGTCATKEDLERVAELHSETWKQMTPITRLSSGCSEAHEQRFKFDGADREIVTHLRVNIFPDGGVARLRVYGEPAAKRPVTDLLLQGNCVAYSNAHYSHPDALLVPGPSKGMHDGWETARSLRRPPVIELDENGFLQVYNQEWAILKLEKTVSINHIEVDTTHFKGNTPDSIKIEGVLVENEQDLKSASWITILKQTKLAANKSNGLKDPFRILTKKPVNHVKIIIAPDGGLARLRIYGSECSM